jgi:hypothetical protein
VDRKVTKALADHWARKVTRETKDMTAKKVTSAKRANEGRKVFKALLVWKGPKDRKVSKAHEVRLDHQVRREKKENWAYPVSLATPVHPARRETKAHLDGLEHPATKEIEYILQMDDFLD